MENLPEIKDFSVFHFNNDNSVAAVPSKWILPRGKSCCWPNESEIISNSKLSDKDSDPGPNYLTLEGNFLKSYCK